MDSEMHRLAELLANALTEGRKKDVQAMIQRIGLERRQDTLESYVKRLIDKSGRSKKDIVALACLPESYMYKVLSGAKRTTQRDYLIAFCCVAGATYEELDRVLLLAGLPQLTIDNTRDVVVLAAFRRKSDRVQLNQWLEECECLPLRTRANTRGLGACIRGETVTRAVRHESTGYSKKHVYTITDSLADYETGCQPGLAIYITEYELTDEHGEVIYLRVLCATFGPLEYHVSKVSYRELVETPIDEDFDSNTFLEVYETLGESKQSEFYDYFVKLDYELDDLIERVTGHRPASSIADEPYREEDVVECLSAEEVELEPGARKSSRKKNVTDEDGACQHAIEVIACGRMRLRDGFLRDGTSDTGRLVVASYRLMRDAKTKKHFCMIQRWDGKLGTPAQFSIHPDDELMRMWFGDVRCDAVRVAELENQENVQLSKRVLESRGFNLVEMQLRATLHRKLDSLGYREKDSGEIVEV